MQPFYRYMFLSIFKSFVIRDMQKNGLIVDGNVTVRQLYRFWFKDYKEE